MGYTHYFKYTIDTLPEKSFNQSVAEIKKLLIDIPLPLMHPSQNVKSKIILCNWEGKKQPEFIDDMVAFNGEGNNSCESFVFTKEEDNSNAFCKTNRLPYDFAVMLSLLSIMQYNADYISLGSDGNAIDWLCACAWYRCKAVMLIPLKVIQYFDNTMKKYPQYVSEKEVKYFNLLKSLNDKTIDECEIIYNEYALSKKQFRD